MLKLQWGARGPRPLNRKTSSAGDTVEQYRLTVYIYVDKASGNLVQRNTYSKESWGNLRGRGLRRQSAVSALLYWPVDCVALLRSFLPTFASYIVHRRGWITAAMLGAAAGVTAAPPPPPPPAIVRLTSFIAETLLGLDLAETLLGRDGLGLRRDLTLEWSERHTTTMSALVSCLRDSSEVATVRQLAGMLISYRVGGGPAIDLLGGIPLTGSGQKMDQR
eukprot:gene12489-biopygen13327